MASKLRDKLAGIFALIEYVQLRGEVLLSTLATEFSIPEDALRELLERISTIDAPHLDLDALPVVDFDLLDSGVVAFNSVPEVEVFSFTVEEAQALLVSLALLDGTFTGQQAETARQLRTKLRNQFELPDWQPLVQVVGATDKVRDVVSAALQSGKWLSFSYVANSGNITNRAVKPLALSIQSGHEVLTAWCQTAGEDRSFRLERMRSVEVFDFAAGAEGASAFSVAVSNADSAADTDADSDTGSATDQVKRRYPKVKVKFTTMPEPLVEAAVAISESPDGVEATFRVLDRKWLETQLHLYADLVVEVSQTAVALSVQQRSRTALELYDLFAQKYS